MGLNGVRLLNGVGFDGGNGLMMGLWVELSNGFNGDV